MRPIELFSKRQKKKRGEIPDVYRYDDIPYELRVQIMYILFAGIGDNEDIYDFIHDAMLNEHGWLELNEGERSRYTRRKKSIGNFLIGCPEIELVLDAVEISMKSIDKAIRNNYSLLRNVELEPDDAIEDINFRFREHGIGFQYTNERIIRVDDEILHKEVLIPALSVLSTDKKFNVAEQEYMKAHEHYRKGNYSDCFVWCLKSFESTMKSICSHQKWPYIQKDTAQKLISICLDNELLPSYLQAEFTSFASVLESGVPTLRNKLGGHGQGTINLSIPQYLCSYVLYLTANNIVLLANAEKSL